jgi:DNA-binding NtrC family response regulator
MLRPWVVHAGDGRLATTRRPFRFVGAILHLMRPLKILVVHPDSTRREELISALQRGEYTVVEADGGDTATAQMAGSIDLMLVDLGLPGLDVAALRRALTGSETAEPDSLEAAERRHLSLVLQHTAGNKRRAALILGISRSTLLNKVRKYRLESR